MDETEIDLIASRATAELFPPSTAVWPAHWTIEAEEMILIQVSGAGPKNIIIIIL